MTRVLSARRPCVFVVAMCLQGLLVLQASCVAGVITDQQLASAAKAAYSANRESLASWQGTATVYDTTNSPKSPPLNRTSHVHFAVDREMDRWSYRWAFVSATDFPVDGAVLGGLFKENSWASLGFSSRATKTSQQVLVTPGRPPTPGPVEDRFDPMSFFLVRGTPFHEVISHWEQFGDSSGVAIRAEKAMTSVTFTVTNAAIPGCLAVYTADLAQGGNVTSVVVTDPEIAESWKTSWNAVDSVWLPNTYEYRNVNNALQRTIERRITFVTDSINTPLDARAFTYEGMGATTDAIIVDKIAGTVTGGKGLLNARPNAQPQSAWSTRRVLIVLNAIVITILLVAMVLYRRRKSKTCSAH